LRVEKLRIVERSKVNRLLIALVLVKAYGAAG
jgi:hypothetical protein